MSLDIMGILFGKPVASGLGCTGQSNDQPADSKPIILSDSEIQHAWDSSDVGICAADSSLNDKSLAKKIAKKIFEQPAFSAAFEALVNQQKAAIEKLGEKIKTKHSNQQMSDLYSWTEWVSHKAACATGGAYGNVFPSEVTLNITEADVNGFLTEAAKLAPEGKQYKPIIPSLVLRRQEDMLKLSIYGPEGLDLDPIEFMYADESKGMSIPSGCEIIIDDQKVAAMFTKIQTGPAFVSKGEGIIVEPVALYLKAQSTIKVNADAVIGLECKTPGFSMELGTVALEQRRAAAPKAPSKPPQKPDKPPPAPPAPPAPPVPKPKEKDCNSMQKSMAILEAMNDGTMTKGKKCKVVNGKVVWK